jgi:hypothetical protein
MYPQKILEAVAEVYASCVTYRDSGQVVTRFYQPGAANPRISVKPFATAFHRPDRFRFEYRDRFNVGQEWNRYIVWLGGKAVRKWWDLCPVVDQPESIGLALAGATGVSGGSAHTIPALLMPDWVGGRRLTQLAELESLEDEPLDTVTCYRLSGRFLSCPVNPTEDDGHAQQVTALTGRRPERAKHSPRTVWIDRGTLLIRRIEEIVQFETFRTETITEYMPEVGVPLSDEELLFDVPEAA